MRTAGEIMTREIITVSPEMGVADLANLFWEKSISGAPVVDAEGKLLGVVTETDLIDQVLIGTLTVEFRRFGQIPGTPSDSDKQYEKT